MSDPTRPAEQHGYDRNRNGGAVYSSPSHDGGFNKFTWMLLAGFGTIMILISSAALSKLWTLGDRVSEQTGDIKVIIANQGYQTTNTTNLANDVRELRNKVAEIERRQMETRDAAR